MHMHMHVLARARAAPARPHLALAGRARGFAAAGVPRDGGGSAQASSTAATAAAMRAQQANAGRMMGYLLAIVAGMTGLTYASVPLYRLFCQVREAPARMCARVSPRAPAHASTRAPESAQACADSSLLRAPAIAPNANGRCRAQATGYGGTVGVSRATVEEKITKYEREPVPAEDLRPIRVSFNTDVASGLEWSFRPVQKEVVAVPGESTLAFFTVKNRSDKPLSGVSAYNVRAPARVCERAPQCVRACVRACVHACRHARCPDTLTHAHAHTFVRQLHNTRTCTHRLRAHR